MKCFNFIFSACLSGILILSGCSDGNSRTNQSDYDPANDKLFAHVKEAVAIINPTKGNTVKGKVTFTKTPEGIKVIADLEGLTPGKHGFHIHEKGDCSAADASSAGGHFNPFGLPHGSPDSKHRHVGDLGNVDADEQGRAHYERLDAMLRFDGPTSILRRSVVIHAQPDDFVTQPAGNSGGRIGCGVIEPINLETAVEDDKLTQSFDL